MGLPENIKYLRKRKKLNQIQLAEAIGVSQRAISAWEKGDRTPRVKQFKALCDFFEVSPSSLYSESPQKIAIERIMGYPKYKALSTAQIKDYKNRKEFSTTFYFPKLKIVDTDMELPNIEIPNIVYYEIEDDSMSPELNPKDKITVELDAPYKNKDIVMFDDLKSDKVLIRRFIINGFRYFLHPTNKSYPNIDLFKESNRYRYIGNLSNFAEFFATYKGQK